VLDSIAQERMQAVPRADIGGPAQHFREPLLEAHELDQPETVAIVINEQVDVAVGARLIPRRRAEQE